MVVEGKSTARMVSRDLKPKTFYYFWYQCNEIISTPNPCKILNKITMKSHVEDFFAAYLWKCTAPNSDRAGFEKKIKDIYEECDICNPNNYLNRRKMPKRVKMLTSKWYRKEKKPFSNTIFDPSNAFGLSRTFFCRKHWGEF